MAMGKRIRERREQLKMTQQQLADAIGKSQSVISSIEKRDSQSSKHAALIAAALGVSVDWLATGEGGPSEEVDDDESRWLSVAREIDQLPAEIRAVVMISMGRDPEEQLPDELTESIRGMLDSLFNMVRQLREHQR